MDKTIPSAELERCLKRVIKYCSLHGSDRIPAIIEYLVKAELEGRNVSQKDILRDVFDGKGDISNVGHRMVELREKLKNYYSEDGAEDNVIFDYQSRQTRITIRPKQKIIDERLGRLEDRFKEVECYYVGNDQAGIEYILEQMPRLSVLRDTHVRPKEGFDKYKPESLERFRQRLTDLLSRSSENRLELIIGYGQMVDEKYLQIFSTIPDEQQDQVRCRKLRYPGSFLNFIILTYIDNDPPKTVMFGWGRQGNEPQAAIFISRDARLVSEFEELYDALNNNTFSEEVDDLADFSPKSAKLVASLSQADLLPAFHSLAHTPILEEMGKCKKIRLITTGINAMKRWRSPMKQALENGACVEIILSHPACTFVQLRGLVQGSDISSMGKTNRQVLRDLKEAGNLTVRLTSEVLSTSHVQLDDMIYFSMFWSHQGSFDGPMLMTQASSKTGKTLTDQFDELWRQSQIDDLSGDIPEPNSYHKRFHLTFPEEDT